MYEIGEIKRGYSLGYKTNEKFIFATCPDCKIGRWTPLIKDKPLRIKCRPCHLKDVCNFQDEHNPNWKGGRFKKRNGYVLIHLSRNDFFRQMSNKGQKGYVSEHRLVMAKHLGRCLHSWEIVHHKNGVKDDNRLENLQLVTDDKHKQITILEQKILYLSQRVTLLEAENARLQKERDTNYVYAKDF